MAKTKYWRNLNLGICNCTYKFLIRHCAFISGIWYLFGRTCFDSDGHLESCVRGHYIYKSTWTPLFGEVLQYKIESGNVQDRYAVSLQHRNISAACSLFLQRTGRICCMFVWVRRSLVDMPQGALYIRISRQIQRCSENLTKFWQMLNLLGIKFGSTCANCQTAKLNSPPNFPTIRYTLHSW